MVFFLWRGSGGKLGRTIAWVVAGAAISATVALAGGQGAPAEAAPDSVDERGAPQPVIEGLQEESAQAPVTPSDAPADESYLIAPGDVLSLYVWQEPELSANLRVRLDGKITVRLIGDVHAEGRTTEELSTEVASRLEELLEVPIVTVGIEDAASAQIFVIGEVRSSGAFQLIGTTTVAQAIALAGGFSEFAKRERIRIIRRLDSGQVAIPFDFNDLGRGKNLAQNLELKAGDTIIVP